MTKMKKATKKPKESSAVANKLEGWTAVVGSPGVYVRSAEVDALNPLDYTSEPEELPEELADLVARLEEKYVVSPF